MSVLKLLLNNKCFVLDSFKIDWSKFECCKFNDADINPVAADDLAKANDYHIYRLISRFSGPNFLT